MGSVSNHATMMRHDLGVFWGGFLLVRWEELAHCNSGLRKSVRRVCFPINPPSIYPAKLTVLVDDDIVG